MLAHRFCNLSPAEAAEVLAGCALLGQATRVKKAAFDLNSALESAKSMGSSAWENAKSGDPLTLSLAGAAGGGLLGALAGHKKRRGSAMTGAMLGALTGGGLSVAIKNFGPASGDLPDTVRENVEKARYAANVTSGAESSANAAKALEAERALAQQGPNMMPKAPAGPGTITDPAFHKSIWSQLPGVSEQGSERLGAGTYALTQFDGPAAHKELIQNQNTANIGGALGAGAGTIGKHVYNEATLPKQMRGVSRDILDKVYKADAPNVVEALKQKPHYRFGRGSGQSIVKGFDDGLARTALQKHKLDLTTSPAGGGRVGALVRLLKAIAPTAAGAGVGYFTGGQIPE